MNSKQLACMAICITALTASRANATFMDVTSVTPGSAGGFEGSIGSVSVEGSLAGFDPLTLINGTVTPNSFDRTVIDGSSLQYSDSSIYTPSNPSGDAVGYSLLRSQGVELLTINFSESVTNPVFHVANLDSMIYEFVGLTAGDLTILSGNGGSDGDGLVIDSVDAIVKDGNPSTIVGVDPSLPPPVFPAARSAYGSISIMVSGSFTSLQIELSQNPATGGGDGGSFQISLPSAVSVPVPASFSLMGLGLALIGFRQHKLGSAAKVAARD
ncbi:hypothetical protein N9089_04430 [Crocinitomicaceae bacterium]|nr:hypothetical protein [Crocinitomicaceae bacterium]